jgi:hypothetical protein
MKFLCVACDQAMTLTRAEPPDRGSIRAVYRCSGCSAEMAMLTNPLETQLVRSLGVEIGPREGREESAEASGCPFSGMLADMGVAGEPQASEFPWTAPALARLDKMPDFVRPMAKTGIEKFARDRGYERVDESVLDEAKSFFGM